MTYQEFYQKSIAEPENFWKEQSRKIDWFKAPKQIWSKDHHDYTQWFADGELNMSYLCIDKHIKDGFGDAIAIAYDSPVTQMKQNITYFQLHEEVSKLAGGLDTLGLEKGDTCIIYQRWLRRRHCYSL